MPDPRFADASKQRKRKAFTSSSAASEVFDESERQAKKKKSHVQFAEAPPSRVEDRSSTPRAYASSSRAPAPAIIESDGDDDESESYLETLKGKSRRAIKNESDSEPEDESDENSENEAMERDEDEDYGEEDDKGLQSEEETEDIKVIPFNMREEMEEGSFDTEGTYVQKARDKFAHHDNWLYGISKKDIRLAAMAHQSRIEIDDKPLPPLEELLQHALAIMRPRESIPNTLARLHRQGQSLKVKEDDAYAWLKQEIETLTEIADQLLSAGRSDIYDETYEDLLGELRDRGIVSREWHPVTWGFQWKDQPEFHGPYYTVQMLDWAKEGYFQLGITLQQYRNGTAYGKSCFYESDDVLMALQ